MLCISLCMRVVLTEFCRRHVKALESRSQLLDAALASADEANRRWEECRALVDQLRVENAALRAALSQAQLLNGQVPNGTESSAPTANSGDQANGSLKDPSNPDGQSDKQKDGGEGN